jgi:hypothetical protein
MWDLRMGDLSSTWMERLGLETKVRKRNLLCCTFKLLCCLVVT